MVPLPYPDEKITNNSIRLIRYKLIMENALFISILIMSSLSLLSVLHGSEMECINRSLFYIDCHPMRVLEASKKSPTYEYRHSSK